MQQQERPPASKFSFKGLLTFPYRICNPPPSIGKVRSCGVTPFLDVHLDDVLERKHLPPLGLKDFEEYLLYVEQSPENLYFLLWLKEYTTRHHIWSQRTKIISSLTPPGTPIQQHPFPSPPSSDPSLALFYAKAKQTFFTPGAEYELDVPSDILAPFHCSPQNHMFFTRVRGTAISNLAPSVHPDPAVFTEVALETRAMLKESLSRFVRAAATNIGSRRAACGIAAGILCLSLAGILPLALTSGGWVGAPHGRWWRLSAFPGMWLGLVLLFSSLNGVCLMVYVFGDLRQLRKFELARPAISRPMPAPAPVVTSVSAPLPHPLAPSKKRSIVISKHHDRQYDPECGSSKSFQSVPYSLSAEGRSFSRASDSYSDSEVSRSSGHENSSSSFESPEIQISPAYFDDVPAPEGPATATGLYRSHYRPAQPSSIAFPSVAHTRERPNPVAFFSPLECHDGNVRNSSAAKPHTLDDSGSFGPSAAFIRHEVDLDVEDDLKERIHTGLDEKECFDFDLLPNSVKGNVILTDNIRLPSNASQPPINVTIAGHIPMLSLETGNTAPSNNLSSAIARQQYKCKRTYAPPLSLVSQISSVPSPNSYTPSPTPSSNRSPILSFMIPSFTAGVPAFKAPMTRVRSPVVIRAQWEVVIRSAVLGLICTITVLIIFIGVIP
ncbi:uncharacterized protein EDB93DRAFT_240495 [Suillus bovinus]|uniref:uncharacterized protein n=1 Tax=Suillus bovinus TaxID=48563 RepID=UPI001B87B505|nr:uncharacterized protein EDB93DRAFT_240495 [Suillus bovinus]KAG2153059.1 hypothetical protein EDB93DRAFT_240495 [Suillus bovinus]